MRRAAAADPHASISVPVFVFELDRDVPVLIDEHYNARAMEDMVLVVANAANQCVLFLHPRLGVVGIA